MKTILVRLIRALITHPIHTIMAIISTIGGVAASDIWIGRLVGTIINIGPVWLPHAVFVVLSVMVLLDWLRDGIAERWATYFPLVLPSIAMAIPEEAKLHTTFAGWINDLNDWLDREIGPWIGGPEHQGIVLTAIAIICIALTVLWNERYAKHGGVGEGDTTTTTTAPATTKASARPSSRRPGSARP